MRLVVGIYYFVSASSHCENLGLVSGFGRGGASGYAFPGRAGERGETWGLFVGLGEAEPLDMSSQAEPGNEGFPVVEIIT